jgi:hypothetical protein
MRCLLVSALASLAPVVCWTDDASSPLTLTAETELGQVWVNLRTTAVRLEEDYVPMVVAVYNRSRRTIELDRESFRLYGSDGRSAPVAGVKELREAYRKISMDLRIASTVGIPASTWSRTGKLVRTNFFPSLAIGRGNTTIDHVSLAPFHGMVDLLYFRRPEGLAAGRPVALVVAAEGWEEPIRMRLQIRQ